ncbi:MAG: hypothetical protein LBE76_04210 [Nitrososphaerota archaeon]|jgi:hypothetical protein|nr:hypothetical protein [Nitrososphaerota archaeon]
MNDKDKFTHINELQFLQREINLLQKINTTAKTPSIEHTIDILRNSQDKLYSALVQHGITSEEVYRVIMENSDKALIKEILQLQSSKNTIETKLSNHNISDKKRLNLERSLALKSEQYTAKWDEIINHPNKDKLITQYEQTIANRIEKARARERTRTHERSR